MFWALVWLVCLSAATLYPFDFGAGETRSGGPEAYGLTPRQLTDIDDNFFNVMLFLPLGALVEAWRRRSRGIAGSIALAGIAGVLVSSVVEYSQAFLPGRHSSLIDLGFNTAGAALGAVGYRLAAPLVEARDAWLRTHDSTALLAGILLAFTALALVASIALQLRTRLSNWSDYPLLVGNEQTGDRPWRGRIIALELTDAAMLDDAVGVFSRGRSVPLPGARLARFDFAGEPPFQDAAGLLPNLDRLGSEGVWADEGFTLEGTSWLRTAGPATAISQRVRASNAFTLFVKCATSDLDQTGPARIVSNSWDTASRNFTLGQRGTAVVFRVRTPHTGPNGDQPELVIPDAFSSDEPREILVTYDGAVLRAAVAGSGRVSRFELSPGSSLVALRVSDFVTSYLKLPRRTVQANALGVYELAYVAAISLLAGGLVGLLGRSWRQRRNTCLIWAFSFSLLLDSALILASGRFFEWRSLADYAAVSTLSTLTGALAVSVVLPKPPPVRAAQVSG